MSKHRWWPVLGIVACGAPEMGAPYQGERLPVVDLHLHPGEWKDIPPATQDLIATRFPFPLGLNATATSEGVLSAEGLVEQLDGGGIEAAGIFAVYAPRSVGVASNELIASIVEQFPDRFYGFASLQVDDWDNRKAIELQRLRDALAIEGMRGVKLAHAHQRFRMDDPAYDEIYAIAAANRAPVYLHTGTSPFPGTQTTPPYCDPSYLEGAIVRHPDTVFILGHLGHDATTKEIGFLDNALDLAETYPNVFLEPSALAKTGEAVEDDNMYVAMKRIQDRGIEAKVIYGSDGPQSPGFVGTNLTRAAAVLEALDYSVADARAIFKGTFDRLVRDGEAP